MRYLQSILAFIFFVCLSFSLLSQTKITPEQLTIQDGLSQGFVSALHQDTEGFLWIGTKNGLNRYDGEQFEIYTSSPNNPYAISHDWVTCIYEKEDYLLLGTIGGGLNIYSKKLKRFYKIPTRDPALKSWATMSIRSLEIDSLGQLWILGNGSGFVFRVKFPNDFWERLSKEESLLEKIEIKGFSDLSLFQMFRGNEKYIYGQDHKSKLLKIDIKTGQTEWLEEQSFSESPLNNIAHISVDAQRILGFKYQENEIIFFNNGKWQTIISELPITNLVYLELQKQLWIRSQDTILMFDDWIPNDSPLLRNNAAIALAHPEYSWSQFLQDRSGNIWIGTGGYGLLKISTHFLHIEKYFDGSSIYATPYKNPEGKIFIGTPEGYLLSTSNPGEEIKILSTEDIARVKWLEGNNNQLWLVGKTEEVVTIYQVTSKNNLQKEIALDCQTEYSHTTLIDNATDAIWVACPNGSLIQFHLPNQKLETFNFQHLFHNNFDCYSMVQTENGHWWIGTSQGLVHGIPDENGYQFELIQTSRNDEKGLLNNEVASILIDPQQNNILWLGTKGGGLHRLDIQTMRFSYVTTENGLPNNVIYGILSDEEGNLWMSSNKGIIKYYPKSGTIRNFNEADGMQNDEFNTWAFAKTRNGELMFGGINGLNVFHPDDLKENTVLPKVWITGIAINNQPIQVNDTTGILTQAIEHTSEITLSFSKNSISLYFDALEFSAPLKNRFRYYLEGAEAPWIHEDADNKATYLNLVPGSYTFKVKGSNGDGIWNEQARELKITILPPWYRSTLAYLIYAILIGLGVWYFQQFRENRFRLKLQVEQEQKEAKRLKELDQTKSRLYTNITHEFRTPLTVISGLINQSNTLEDIKEPIQRNTDQLLNLVNQMLELRKLESGNMPIHYQQGDIIRYIRYLTESFQSYANSNGVTFHFLTEHESLIIDFDKEKITRIISNLFSNAIKFTPNGGNVYIRTEVKETQIYFEIKDTGQGIPETELPHIFNRFYQVDGTATRKGEGTGIGLTLVKELLTAMKGEIKVSSKEGKGTTFIIMLPITNDAPMSQAEHQFQNIFIPKKITEKEKTELVNATISTTDKPSEKPTVLLIEDNADVIHYLIKCLQSDYDLDIAMNGEEGIDKAIENTPDFIVSDVMMPKKDGFEVCQTLKSDERTSHIPIILLTAKANIESRLEGLQRGADAYLSKPFHQKELLLHIQNFLALRQKMQARFANVSDTLSAEQAGSKVSDTLSIPLEIEDAFLQKIRAIIEKDLSDGDIGMPQLIRGLGMSRSQIYKKVKALTGHSPSRYIRSIRLFHARKLLETTDLNVSEVAYECGFSTPFYFSNVFFDEFGVRPKETRK